MKYAFLLLVFAVLLMGSDEVEYPERRAFRTPSFQADSLISHAVWVSFNDTIGSDTLFIHQTKEGLIHSYSRLINTGVCIDGQCRRLSMTLYWTPAGRYFGFVLPRNEFLSKTEHVPFKDEDYKRLEEILANPYSALADYKIEDLISGDEHSVDGVTAATLQSVKQETVPDAVYTTYTLWHIVYGITQKEIQKYTRERLTDRLVIRLLNSPDFEDRFWTLENMGPKLKWSPELKQEILKILVNEKDIISVKALAVIPDSVLEEEAVQNSVGSSFLNMAFGNQRRIIERLSQIPVLSHTAAVSLAKGLDQIPPGLTGELLSLFEKHQVNDPQIDEIVIGLLDHKNQWVARNAAAYLSTRNIKSGKVKRQISRLQ